MRLRQQSVIIAKLNNMYNGMVSVPENVCAGDVLKKMAELLPYRWLNDFSFEVQKKISPLSSWQDKFKAFPDHIIFFEKLKAAQKNANECGKRSQICWRGFRTSVLPKKSKGELGKKEFLTRLITALKNISKISSEEKQVNKILIYLIYIKYLIFFTKKTFNNFVF